MTPQGPMIAAGLLVLLLAGSASGCAGDWVEFERGDGRVYRHHSLGYVIAYPPESPGDAWSPVSVEGADLAFRHSDGAVISMSSSCRETRAAPAQLGRHLMIGIAGRKPLKAGRLMHAGDEGWWQIVDAEENGAAVRIKTVTLLAGGCVFDWVLVAPEPGGFGWAEPLFDRWWASFERPSSEDVDRREPVDEETAP